MSLSRTHVEICFPGENKGQQFLKKGAVPSRNLPPETPMEDDEIVASSPEEAATVEPGTKSGEKRSIGYDQICQSSRKSAAVQATAVVCSRMHSVHISTFMSCIQTATLRATAGGLSPCPGTSANAV